ncbi:hypothetical protein TIFTF001_017034 [Ficus carica]|uniref:Retrotransposon Copia-like N-terminal domain-containing protein n=1 Tax=Ficus carica TaxID=3494 RepID=A0AA88A487_FICCA|nr:hypothetical protein TIFTF001_017034 [Ficus carica]
MSGASGNDSEAHSRASQSVSTIVPAVTVDNTSQNLQITTQKLNGKNFLQWSCSAALVIRGKGKIAFIDGSSPRPDVDDPSYASWDSNNSLVMAWLIHSMEDEIGETNLSKFNGKEIWDAVALAYSDLENSSQLFELRNWACNLHQGDMDVNQYYNSLRKLWQEVDMFHSVSWKNPAGLNKELDDVRGRLVQQNKCFKRNC